MYIVTNDCLGKHFSNLCGSPMDALTLLVIYLKCSLKFNFSSKTKQGVFGMELVLPGYCWKVILDDLVS